MNIRFRAFVILLGAAVVALTWTYPLWVNLFQEGEIAFPFPELDESLHEAFNALSSERQQDYLQLRHDKPLLAIQMATAGLEPDVVVAADLQAKPNIAGEIEVLTGDFIDLSPNRGADGTATIYELPDGSRYLWLSDFRAVRGPDLRLYLSVQSSDMLVELEEDEELQLALDDNALGRLTANVGSQRFDVPSEADLALFNSIILYSQELNLVYSIADLG